MPLIQKDVSSNYAYFPVIFDSNIRDIVYDVLLESGISTRKYFYPPTNELSCYKGRSFKGNTENAHKISSSVLCLPLYGDLKESEVESICSVITKVIMGRGE